MPNNDEELLVKVGAENATDAGLSAAVESVKSSVDSMIDALEKLVASSKESADHHEDSNKRVGESFEEAGEKVEGATKAMEASFGAAGKAVAGLSLIVAKAVKGFHLLFTAIGGGLLFHAIGELGGKSGEYADSILRASEKTGIATDRLQELRYAAEANHVSFGQLQVSLQRIATQMQQAEKGSASAVARFKLFNIEAHEIKGLGLDGVLERIAVRMQETTNNSNKAAASQQMLGRGGRELIPFLNQGAEGMKKMAEEARHLGVVMEYQDLLAAKKLQDQMHELHTVNEVLERKISSALVPAFLAISKAMVDAESHGGMFEKMINGIATALKGVTWALSIAVQGLVQWGTTIGAVLSIAAQVDDINFTDLFGDENKLRSKLAAIKSTVSDWKADMDKMGADGSKFRDAIFNPPGVSPPKKDKPDIGTPDNKNKHVRDERLSEWRYELEQMKEAEGYFQEFSKAREAEFWRAKLELIDRGTKEGERLYRQVDALRYQGMRAQAHEDEAAYQREVNSKLSAVRTNYAAQLVIIEQNLEHIKGLYREDSAQYRAEQEKQTEIKRKQIAEIAKLNEMMVESDKRRRDANINAAQNETELDLALGRISVDQKLALDVSYENQRYQNALASAGKKLELERATGQLSYEAERQMIAGIEDLNIAHEAKLLQIKQAGIREAERYRLEATQAARADFNTLLGDLSEGVKGAKKSFMDFFKSLGKSINDVATKKLTDMLMGPGTAGGGILDNIMGKLFGAGTDGLKNTASAAADASLVAFNASVSAATPAMMAMSAAQATATPIFIALTAAAEAAATALAAVAAGSAGSAAAGMLSKAIPVGTANGIPEFATGTSYVPRDMLAMVHKGEGITPAKYNNAKNTGGVTQNNHFALMGPVDSRTQDQIAAAASRGLSRAGYRGIG